MSKGLTRYPCPTILVADDDPAVVTVLQCMLEALGYRVLTARDGAGAIRVFEAHWRLIDVVLLEMGAPRTGGKETWERLRRIDPGMRVLLFSGYWPGVPALEILAEGGSDYIQKPFGLAELAAKLRGLLQPAQP